MAALQTFGMPSRRKKSPLERGERVYLRQPTAADAKEVTVTVRASRDLHRPWVYPTETKTAFDGYIRRTKESDYVGLLICRNSDDAAHCRVTRGARASPFWVPSADAGIVQALLSTNTQISDYFTTLLPRVSRTGTMQLCGESLEVKKKRLERAIMTIKIIITISWKEPYAVTSSDHSDAGNLSFFDDPYLERLSASHR